MNKKRRSRKSILGRNEAKSLLDAHFDDLIFGLNDGIAHFGKIPPAQMAHYRKRTKANMLNDHIVECLKIRLDNVPGVQIDDEHDGTFFVFDGQLAMRVKKIDTKDSTRNVKTDRQRELDNQQLQLAGIQRLTFVSYGYLLDASWASVSAAKVLCKFGWSTQWVIDVIEGIQAATPLLHIDDTHFDDGVDVRSTRDDIDDGSA